MRIRLILITMILTLLTACSDDGSKDPLDGSDPFLVFGDYFGHCFGDCWHLYKIEGGKLYADSFDHPRDGEITFSSSPLSDELYIEALTLVETIPRELLTSQKETFGCPDCADQGGYFIEVKEGEGPRSFNLDRNRSAIDEEAIRNYLDRVDVVLLLLQ